MTKYLLGLDAGCSEAVLSSKEEFALSPHVCVGSSSHLRKHAGLIGYAKIALRCKYVCLFISSLR